MAENENEQPENNADIPADQAPEVDVNAEPQYTEIPNRSSANAKRALQAAENVDGFDFADVRTTSTGFLVPSAVGTEYERLLAEENAATTAIPEPTEPTGDAGQQAGEPTQPIEVVEPKKSGSKKDWEAFAATKGYDVAEDLSRDELVARFGTAE